jgi:hypothetical protein
MGFTDKYSIDQHQQQSSTPAAPGSGTSIIYPKTDGFWYYRNAGGVETQVGASSPFTGGTLSSELILKPGTAAASGNPLSFQSGPILTTRDIGSMEYLTPVLYFTPEGPTRGYIAVKQILTNTAVVPLSNVATSQSVFGTSVALQANTTYRFQGIYHFTKGATSADIRVGFTYSGTLGSIAYHAIGNVFTTPSNGSGQLAYSTTLSNVQCATAATGLNGTARVDGLIRVTTGGNLNPQMNFNVAPGATTQTNINSFFEIWPIGSNTMTTII